jgi:hypothetical protein
MGLLFKLNKRIMTCLVLELRWKSLHGHLLLQNYIYFGGYISHNLCLWIFLLNGKPMKVSLLMLVSWSNIFLGFHVGNTTTKGVHVRKVISLDFE